MPQGNDLHNEINIPLRPGTTTTTKYSCGHMLCTTTNSVVYDPAGVLCETQVKLESSNTCGYCEEIKKNELPA